MNEEDYAFDNESSSSTEIDFHVAATYQELVALRKNDRGPILRPLGPTVDHLLLNGCGNVYETHIAPVLEGKTTYGSLIANEAVLGHLLMVADAAGDNLISQCNPPRYKNGSVKEPITAQLVGRKILENARKTYLMAPRSFVATGLLK